MNRLTFLLLFAISIQILCVSSLQGQYKITNSNLTSGSASSINNAYKLNSNAAPQYISSIQNNQYKIQHGFWMIKRVVSKVDKDNLSIPTKYELFQNYPNPFNPTTVIKFGLPETSNVRIEIYNMLGQRVDIVTNENKASGYHEVTWNASNFSSGIFLISITAIGTETGQSYNQVKKALLLK